MDGCLLIEPGISSGEEIRYNDLCMNKIGYDLHC